VADLIASGVVTLIIALLTSSGFWAFIKKRDQIKDANAQLLIGLAHDRVIHLGMRYIERGWVTKDEYENFVRYLYTPYLRVGGNGLAQKVAEQVAELPFHKARVEVTSVSESTF
jgi:hypothetical protein